MHEYLLIFIINIHINKYYLCKNWNLNKTKNKKIDSIVLGCTHYPLIKKEINFNNALNLNTVKINKEECKIRIDKNLCN